MDDSRPDAGPGGASAGGGDEFGVRRLTWETEFAPGEVAAYLIEGPEPILVDAGNPGEDGRERLLEVLAAHDLEPGDVAHVVVTHPHTDHTGQVPVLADAGATVYASQMACDQLARDPDDLAAGVRETATLVGVPDDLVSRFVDGAVDSLERNRQLLPPDEVDVVFDLDETVTVGDLAFEPIHAPGHQKALTCFAVERDGRRLLFSGDGLIEPFRPAALHAGLDREAFEAIGAFYAGMDRLAGREVDRVFPGHGPVFDDFAGAVAATVDRLDGLVADVADALAAVEPATPNEVTIERVGIPEHLGPVLDTVGALGHLDETGRATFEVGDDGARRYRSVD